MFSDNSYIKKRTPLKDNENQIVADKICPSCGTYYFEISHDLVDGINAMGTWFTCNTRASDGVCGSTMLILSDSQRAFLKLHGKSVK